MKKILLIPAIILILTSLMYSGCINQKGHPLFTIMVGNKTDLAFQDVPVELDLESTGLVFSDTAYDRMVLQSDTSHPYQFIDYNKDGLPDKLILLTDLLPGETRKISALPSEQRPEFAKRTQAELSIKTGGSWDNREYIGGTFLNVDYLRVPPEHTDHSYFIRYEGPGWESDRVGYRFYLDWRNAIDVFGKLTPQMVLQDVGQDGFDSYHEPADWGMDILKVGESLGLGSIGIWMDGKANRVAVTDSITCEIVSNGPVYSEILTSYYGWQAGETKSDLYSSLSITAGSRMTRHHLTLSEELPNLCTGIVKDENANLMVNQPTGSDWSYIATYGVQSLAQDKLGMAVLFRSNDLLEIVEDIYSHIVVLEPEDQSLTYYFLAAWEKEKDGIESEDEFTRHLNKLLLKLNNPPEATINF